MRCQRLREEFRPSVLVATDLAALGSSKADLVLGRGPVAYPSTVADGLGEHCSGRCEGDVLAAATGTGGS